MKKFKVTDLQGTTTLSNGVRMPYFGLGVFKSEEGDEVISAVETALDFGYRHIDTAAFYENERGVGQAIKNRGLSREDVFVTSKVWNDDLRKGNIRKAFEHSLKALDLEFLDLYLIHWPVPGRFIEAWKVLEGLLDEGLVRSIGVSNFLTHHLRDLMATSDVVPMVNQLEFHPHLQQPELLDFCRSNGIQYEGWAPLMRGEVLGIPELKAIGETYGKSPAQIALRWNLQKGVVAIPKSVKEDRIRTNADIFDFELSEKEMFIINSLDQNRRIGPDPDHFNF